VPAAVGSYQTSGPWAPGRHLLPEHAQCCSTPHTAFKHCSATTPCTAPSPHTLPPPPHACYRTHTFCHLDTYLISAFGSHAAPAAHVCPFLPRFCWHSLFPHIWHFRATPHYSLTLRTLAKRGAEQAEDSIRTITSSAPLRTLDAHTHALSLGAATLPFTFPCTLRHFTAFPAHTLPRCATPPHTATVHAPCTCLAHATRFRHAGARTPPLFAALFAARRALHLHLQHLLCTPRLRLYTGLEQKVRLPDALRYLPPSYPDIIAYLRTLLPRTTGVLSAFASAAPFWRH